MDTMYYYMMFWKNALNFKTRSRRMEAFAGLGMTSAIVIMLDYFIRPFVDVQHEIWMEDLVHRLVYSAALLPILSLSVRRFHDFGWSTWWVVPNAIGMYGIVFDAKTSFDLPFPDIISDPLEVVGIIYGLILFYVILLKKGEEGSNRFGDDPKDDSLF